MTIAVLIKDYKYLKQGKCFIIRDGIIWKGITPVCDLGSAMEKEYFQILEVGQSLYKQFKNIIKEFTIDKGGLTLRVYDKQFNLKLEKQRPMALCEEAIFKLLERGYKTEL